MMLQSMVIEYLYSPLCKVCTEVEPIFAKIAKQKRVAVEQINILTEEGAKKAKSYMIEFVPCVVINKEHKLTYPFTKEELMRYVS
jgi:thioredoxin-like negative regulator of GroEL